VRSGLRIRFRASRQNGVELSEEGIPRLDKRRARGGGDGPAREEGLLQGVDEASVLMTR
jgi:hypothetical protein